MKKRVVLIYPEGRLEGNYPHQKGHPYTQTLPISLLPMAYFLENSGYSTQILDARIEDYKGVNLEGVICVGISVMTGMQISNALEIAKYIRQENPELPVVRLTVPFAGWLLPSIRLSDHASFWDYGFKAVMITDSSFYRNPHYHLPTDTMDKLDYRFMAELVKSLLSFFQTHLQ